MSDPKVEYVGPFQTTHVVYGGRQVPLLEATILNGGKISLSLDRRFGLDLTVAEAEKVVPFLAEAIAVAMGYACHPSASEEPVPLPPFRRMTEVPWGRQETA